MRALQRITLQSCRKFLQRADAGGFGLVAPGLQCVQPVGGVLAARFQHRGEAAAMLDQGRDARALGDERLHTSHRSNLLRKAPEWYGQFGWTEAPDMAYWWPRREMKAEG